MTDERRAGLREVRDWVAQHAMRWSKAPFGTTVVDAEELDAYLAALAPTQVPARDPDPMLGWRLAKCPHCGEELSVPAQEERLDVRRVKRAIVNIAKRHGIAPDEPKSVDTYSLAAIYGYSRSTPDMDAEIAREYRALGVESKEEAG